MQIAVTALLIMGLAGCTSMLLGDNASSDMTAASADRSASQVAQDDAISASIRQQFGADSAVRHYAIGIRTANRNVTLSGTVGSYQVRDRAVQIVRDTKDVARVNNRLIVNTNL